MEDNRQYARDPLQHLENCRHVQENENEVMERLKMEEVLDELSNIDLRMKHFASESVEVKGQRLELEGD